VTQPTRYWLSIGDGKTYGPYTVAELQRCRLEGRVGFDAKICQQGDNEAGNEAGNEWLPASTVLDFGAPPTSPPTSPPPPPPPATATGAQFHPNAKSKVAAGVLGILLGSLGIHNFYLGYTGKGLAQLLITVLTCGYGACISWIWGLIEGILILTGSITVDGNGVPMRD